MQSKLGIVVKEGTRELNPGGVPFGIFEDDTPEHIANVVYAYNPQPKYYPPLVKVTKRDRFVQIESLISLLESIPELSTMYFDPFGMEELYERFSEDYAVEMYQFIGAVEYTLFELQDTPRVLLADSSALDSVIESSKTLDTEGIKRVQKRLAPFFTKAYSDTFSHSFVSKYTNTAFMFRLPTAAPLKLINAFNKFEMEPDFPFIALFDKGTPIALKVTESLRQLATNEEIKSFVSRTKGSDRKNSAIVIKHIQQDYTVTARLEESSGHQEKLTVVVTAKYESKEYISMEVMKARVTQIVRRVCEKMDTVYSADSTVILSTALVETQNLLNLTTLKRVIEDYPELPFVKKTLTTEDMLSCVYRSQITLNVKRNMHSADSSLVVIYNAGNVDVINTIMKYLFVIDNIAPQSRVSNRFLDILDNSEGDAFNVRERGRVKEIRQRTGLKIDSKKCQRERQPVLYDDGSPQPLPDVTPESYILEYRGIKYMCPKPEMPYPGFNVDNTPCCFKKPQRDKPGYIRNVASDIVQASNFPVTITYGQTSYTTYLIRRGDRLLILSPTGQGVMDVTDNVYEPDESVWLKEVSLSTLLNTPGPDLSRVASGLHAPCENNANRYFGFGASGLPGCFRKEQIAKSKVTSTSAGIGYILQRDKILKPGQVGVLGGNVARVVEDIDKDRKYYKVGVESHSLASAVQFATEKAVRGDVRRALRAMGYNLIVLNVPYVNSKTVIELDYKGTKIECGDYTQIDMTIPFIVLIRKGDVYEVVVELKNDVIENKVHKDVPLTRLLTNFFQETCVKRAVYPEGYPFDPMPTVSDVGDYVLQLTNVFGKVEYIVKQNGLVIPVHSSNPTGGIPTQPKGTYSWLPLNDTLRRMRESRTVTPRGVTVDSSGNVTAVLTNYGQLVPVAPGGETGTGGLPVLPYKFYMDLDQLIRPSTKIVITSILNNMLASNYVKGHMDSPDKIASLVRKGSAELYSKGRLVYPLSESDVRDVVEYFVSGQKLRNTGENPGDSPATRYTESVRQFRKFVGNLAIELSKYTSQRQRIRDRLAAIVTNNRLSRHARITQVRDILREIPTGEHVSDFVLDLISADIVSDPDTRAFIENNLEETLDPQNVIVSEEDTAMFNLTDFERWLNVNLSKQYLTIV